MKAYTQRPGYQENIQGKAIPYLKNERISFKESIKEA